MDRGALEAYLREGLSLERIGDLVDLHPSTVAYWLKRHGLRAAGSERFSRRGALSREELEPLVDAGLTLQQMADRLDRSVASVRSWLVRHGLKTARAAAREAAAKLHPRLSAVVGVMAWAVSFGRAAVSIAVAAVARRTWPSGGGGPSEDW